MPEEHVGVCIHGKGELGCWPTAPLRRCNSGAASVCHVHVLLPPLARWAQAAPQPSPLLISAWMADTLGQVASARPRWRAPPSPGCRRPRLVWPVPEWSWGKALMPAQCRLPCSRAWGYPRASQLGGAEGAPCGHAAAGPGATDAGTCVRGGAAQSPSACTASSRQPGLGHHLQTLGWRVHSTCPAAIPPAGAERQGCQAAVPARCRHPRWSLRSDACQVLMSARVGSLISRASFPTQIVRIMS